MAETHPVLIELINTVQHSPSSVRKKTLDLGMDISRV